MVTTILLALAALGLTAHLLTRSPPQPASSRDVEKSSSPKATPRVQLDGLPPAGGDPPVGTSGSP